MGITTALTVSTAGAITAIAGNAVIGQKTTLADIASNFNPLPSGAGQQAVAKIAAEGLKEQVVKQVFETGISTLESTVNSKVVDGVKASNDRKTD